MSGHTSGPWEAISWHIRKVRTDEDRGGWLIASAADSPLEEKRENARLLAAAPELLAALERWFERADDCMEEPACGCCLWCTANAAITKARGE